MTEAGVLYAPAPFAEWLGDTASRWSGSVRMEDAISEGDMGLGRMYRDGNAGYAGSCNKISTLVEAWMSVY